MPILGRTWYRRGFLYWTIRVGNAGLTVLSAVAWVAMAEGALDAIAGAGTAEWNVLAVIDLMFTLVSGGWLIWRYLLSLRLGRPAGLFGSGPRKRPRPMTVRGRVIATVVYLALIPMIVFISLVAGGLMLLLVFVSLMPELPGEQTARQKIASDLRLYYARQQPRHRLPNQHRTWKRKRRRRSKGGCP